MDTLPTKRDHSFSSSLYRLLLFCYPAEFREHICSRNGYHLSRLLSGSNATAWQIHTMDEIPEKNI